MSVNVYTTNQMNKDLKKKFTKTFDLSQIAEDPMDSYLDTLGLWKKRIARDGSCLFRAVAEQIYPCQMYHEKVRQECIRYMSEHRDEYAKYVSTITFDEYLEAMKNPLENGGQLEIASMSKFYQCDFIIFQHQDQPGIDVTQNGYEKKIYLCYSYNNHFDAIFSKAHRDRLAMIQSLVYELLYDRVFGSGEQVSVARKLLRKSDTIYPKEYMQMRQFDEFGNEIDTDDEPIDHELLNELNEDSDTENENEDNRDDTEDNEEKEEDGSKKNSQDLDQKDSCETSDQNNNDTRVKNNNKKSSKKSKKSESSDQNSNNEKTNIIQKMPLPYKVAKSLDPYIYRNTAFDAWLATKKELEQAANLNAISVLQPGDKCMVKLVNNYTEKWSLAFLQNILPDSANVFVPELNESHCVPLDYLKVYNNANELLLIHYTGQQFYPNPIQPLTYQNNPNGVQNVQKFVQSVNSNFSKIFISSDNKRRTPKKKQFAMKKSSSFHAFSTELPTLVEVEEQTDDLFLYGGHHYYPGHPHHGHHHHHPFHHHHHHHHQSNSSGNNNYLPTSQTFHSLPHSQTHPNFTDHISSSNKPPNSGNKNNQGGSLLTTVNTTNNSTSNMLLNSANNQNNMNKNRKQRFNNQTNGQNNLSNNNNKNSWNNNPNGPNSNPAYLSHQLAPPLAPQLAPTQTPHLPLSALPPPPPPQSLAPLVGPVAGQPFLPPPLPPLHHHHQPPTGGLPGPNQAFMHHPPPPQPPLGPHPHAPQLGHQPRPNFFNPISSPFMFGPPQPVPAPLGHISHPHPHMPNLLDHPNPAFYFPGAPATSINGTTNNNNNPTNTSSATNSLNKNQQNIIERKQRHESVDSYLNKTSNTNNSYQQVPQHLTNQSLLNQSTVNSQSNTSNITNEATQSTSTTNPNNYLLMPAPPANTSSNTTSLLQPVSNQSLVSTTPGSYTTSNSLTRSHSYHSGISTYETHNQLVNPNNNSSNVYIDVYMPPQQAVSSNQQSHLAQNQSNQSGIIGTNNQQNMYQSNTPMMNNPNSSLTGSLNNSTNTQQLYSSNNNNMIGLDANGYSTGFSGYEMQYSRFDNNLSNNSNGIIDDNLLNSSDRTSNLWNKTNKLTKSTSLFSDMMYAGENTQTNLIQMPNSNNNQQFCYTNCFVVNIDGPINFNATHSLQDDGSDLPFNDVNTVRFFYNLGIEYYRLNIAPPYNQVPGYSTLYAPNASGNPNTILNNGANGNSTLISSTSNNSLSAPTDQQIIDPNGGTQLTSQQVVPNPKQQQQQQQPAQQNLMQQSYTSTRRVH